jgi:uncharacterized protein (TIGR02996 family)
MFDPSAALHAVLDRPHDRAARLAYASALDARHDPLGEFIRLETDLADEPRDPAELPLWDRRLALREAHGAAWLAPLAGRVESTAFRGGLVEHVQLSVDSLLAHGAAIFERFPVRSLAIRDAGGRMAELLACPGIERVESLAFPGWFDIPEQASLTDADIAALAASTQPHRLRFLDLTGNRRLGPASVAALLDSPWCGRLETLNLGWTAVGDEGAARLAATDRLDGLRSLDLSRTGLGPEGVRALADSPTLACLGLIGLDVSLNASIDTAAYVQLLGSPVLARVSALDLDGAVNVERVEALARSPSLGSLTALRFANSWTVETDAVRRLAAWEGLARVASLTYLLSGFRDEQLGLLAATPAIGGLKSLILSETEVSDDGLERLARSPHLGRLDALHIDRNTITARAVRAVLAAPWFPRLRTLDFHASYRIGDAGAAALADYRGPSHLRELVLNLCGIGDAGARALADAPFARRLWTLWLHGNPKIATATAGFLKARFGGRVATDTPEEAEECRRVLDDLLE